MKLLAVSVSLAVMALSGCAAVKHPMSETPVPDPPDDRLAMLEPDQREFIASGAALKFMPARQLDHELASEYRPYKAPIRWPVPAPLLRRHLHSAFAATH
jgi:hypothetical protein